MNQILNLVKKNTNIIVNEFKRCTRVNLHIFSYIFQCVASGVFAIGLWIRFDEDMVKFVETTEIYFYWNCTAALITGACAVMVTSFVACCAVFSTSKKTLLAVSFFYLINNNWRPLSLSDLTHIIYWVNSLRLGGP